MLGTQLADNYVVLIRDKCVMKNILLLKLFFMTNFSVICCVAGLIALAVLPVLAKNTYISENALLPG